MAQALYTVPDKLVFKHYGRAESDVITRKLLLRNSGPVSILLQLYPPTAQSVFALDVDSDIYPVQFDDLGRPRCVLPPQGTLPCTVSFRISAIRGRALNVKDLVRISHKTGQLIVPIYAMHDVSDPDTVSFTVLEDGAPGTMVGAASAPPALAYASACPVATGQPDTMSVLSGGSRKTSKTAPTLATALPTNVASAPAAAGPLVVRRSPVAPAPPAYLYDDSDEDGSAGSAAGGSPAPARFVPDSGSVVSAPSSVVGGPLGAPSRAVAAAAGPASIPHAGSSASVPLLAAPPVSAASTALLAPPAPLAARFPALADGLAAAAAGEMGAALPVRRDLARVHGPAGAADSGPQVRFASEPHIRPLPGEPMAVLVPGRPAAADSGLGTGTGSAAAAGPAVGASRLARAKAGVRSAPVMRTAQVDVAIPKHMRELGAVARVDGVYVDSRGRPLPSVAPGLGPLGASEAPKAGHRSAMPPAQDAPLGSLDRLRFHGTDTLDSADALTTAAGGSAGMVGSSAAAAGAGTGTAAAGGSGAAGGAGGHGPLDLPTARALGRRAAARVVRALDQGLPVAGATDGSAAGGRGRDARSALTASSSRPDWMDDSMHQADAELLRRASLPSPSVAAPAASAAIAAVAAGGTAGPATAAAAPAAAAASGGVGRTAAFASAPAVAARIQRSGRAARAGAGAGTGVTGSSGGAAGAVASAAAGSSAASAALAPAPEAGRRRATVTFQTGAGSSSRADGASAPARRGPDTPASAPVWTSFENEMAQALEVDLDRDREPSPEPKRPAPLGKPPKALPRRSEAVA